MKHSQRHNGFSLIEILVVMAIIVVVAGIGIKVAGVMQKKAKTKNTETAISVLVNALEVYKQKLDKRNGQFAFPPDPKMVEVTSGSISADSWNAVLHCFVEINGNNTSILDFDTFPGQTLLRYDINNLDTNKFDHESMGWKEAFDTYSYHWALGSIEVLYAYLSNVPDCVPILNRLPQQQTGNDDRDSIAFVFGGGGGSVQAKALTEVNDAWGAPLRYRNMGKGNFPVIDSAGEDGEFDTADDIVSNEI